MDSCRLTVVQENDRTHHAKYVDSVAEKVRPTEKVWPLTERCKHLGCSTAMANESELFHACFLQDESDYGRYVVLSHLLEGKFPVILVLIGVLRDMISGVNVPARVVHPDIESCICKEKR